MQYYYENIDDVSSFCNQGLTEPLARTFIKPEPEFKSLPNPVFVVGFTSFQCFVLGIDITERPFLAVCLVFDGTFPNGRSELTAIDFQRSQLRIESGVSANYHKLQMRQTAVLTAIVCNQYWAYPSSHFLAQCKHINSSP